MSAVAVYAVGLDADDATVRTLARWLSAEERARADRFVAVRDRRRFIVRRGALRAILADALGEAPANVPLRSSQGRRPEVAGSSIHLSTSSSDELGVIAMHAEHELGIDVERLRAIHDWVALTAGLASEERDALRAMPPETGAHAFLRAWTRKEAYLKAIGVGLELPLDAFAVSVGEAAQVTRSHDGTPAEVWSLVELSPADGYIAALATQGLRPRVELRVETAAAVAERHG